ncbi:MAG: DMT family transporter [Candidatus Eremiobacteraeota bacterium]|nr:DMT family transporter [Candidatus Eremiobacteraeota bacterium]MBV9409337.1 DMT family transporter [Candidatus Eremiobacteraeota bacterium]
MTPLRRGFVWAALAALAFGVTTPLVARFGAGVSTWTVAGCLYLGGALFAAASHRDPREALRGLRARWPVLVAIGVVGGALAPAAYVLGLRDAGPLAASLALNMETPFSVALAALAFREHVGRRVVVAMLAIVAGACALSLRTGGGGAALDAGVLLVVAATALWALDNALSSRAQDLDPRVTVFWKSAFGAAFSFAAAALLREVPGPPMGLAALLTAGALGYGASLVLYLTAQRTFGVARTASVFAIAPFVGATGALLLGDNHVDALGAAAFAFMLVGVWLHATERHRHVHRHEPLVHEHPHLHDDLHHDHTHPEPVVGEHTHTHAHGQLVHTHDHAPDVHHDHEHGHDHPEHA